MMRKVVSGHTATGAWVLSAILFLVPLVGVACAERAPREVHAGPDESGSKIPLHVGDTLTLDIGSQSGVTWRLVSYPGSLMALEGSNKGDGHFELVARQPGRGSINASVVANCGPPALRAPECPVEAMGQQDISRDFTVTVQISE